MSDVASSSFVREVLVPERPAPVKTTGFIGFVRTRLLNSPTNILLTVLGTLLIWFTVIPALRFLLVDAVWHGSDRTACLSETAGHLVGACWPFIEAKFDQLVYGFYPEAERWRVNLTFLLAGLLLLPLLIPRLPAKGLNAGLFFLAFPVVAFFLLHGGGLNGFGVRWVVGLLAAFADSFNSAGDALTEVGARTAVIGPLLWLVGKLFALLGAAVSLVIWPLTWLRDQIQTSSQPVWTDFAITTVVVSAFAFWLSGGLRTGWRALVTSLISFAVHGDRDRRDGLDRGGLPIVDTRLWGGLLVTLVVSVTGIVASMPIGIALALGRRSTIPLIRIFSVTFIEFWRGVPLITVLFFATYMLPLFLPGNFSVDGLVRALIGIALFAGAYQAEVDPRRPAGDPARARGGRERARAVLVEDDGADRAAAGAAPRHSRPRQQLHRAVQGYHPGLDRRAVRSTWAVARVVLRSELGDADDAVYRLCLHRDDLFRVLLWNVALFAVR